MDFAANLDQLKIPQEIITVIASGDSADKITKEQYSLLYKNTFVLTMNYGIVKFLPHANIWSDIKCTDFIKDMYSREEKKCLFISRRDAWRIPEHNEFHKKIDHWFETRNLKCNYTLSWIFQLLQKHFPNKKVLVFGLDLKPIDDEKDIKKFYDRYIKFDAERRGKNFPLQRKLDAFQNELIRLKNENLEFDTWCSNVLNMNSDSNCHLFKKSSWDDLPKDKFPIS